MKVQFTFHLFSIENNNKVYKTKTDRSEVLRRGSSENIEEAAGCGSF